MSEELIRKEAIILMHDFVRHHLVGLENIVEQEDRFTGESAGVRYILVLADKPILPAEKFVDETRDNAVKGIATGLLMVRSTASYQGFLLKQMPHGLNYQKRLTLFEQEVFDLCGNKAYYFNPQTREIQVIAANRFYEIPEWLTNIPWDVLEKNSGMRQQYHIHEAKRNSDREISISEKINGPFTLVPYPRKTKPLIARLAPVKKETYQPSLGI